MADAPPEHLGESPDSVEDEALDAIVRAVAHAPPRVPLLAPAHPGDRWGAEGRYIIEARLGRGGMGTVYSATDTLLHRTVALKVLDTGRGDDEAGHRARLLREARLAARIEHERVARIYDVGEHQGALFVAMELVRGSTLRGWMAERRVTAAEVVTVAGQIADGLAALHAAGVFHRDLKPENVMIAEQGGIRLLDFGLARDTGRAGAEGPAAPSPTAGSTESRSLGGLSGTPAYMAPEQWAGEPLDARVDVFALGVIVYELVTGTRPFVAPAGSLKPPAWVTPDFSGEAWAEMPPALAEIAARMLARAPADRFADGAAVRDALDALAVDPVPSAALVPATTSAHAELSTGAPLVQASPDAAPVRRPPRWTRAWIAAGVTATLGAAALFALRVAGVGPFAPRRSGELLPRMAWIDAGTLTVGHTPEDLDRECAAIGPSCKREVLQREVPPVRVTVKPFQLDMYEVNNEEMARWLQSLTRSLVVTDDEDDHFPRYVRWNNGLGHDGEFLVDLDHRKGGIEYRRDDRSFHARPGRELLPATQLTWYAADLYCKQLGKSLPTENEWEAAARGRDDRPYPWGKADVRCGEVVIPRDGALRMPAECADHLDLPGRVGEAKQDVTPEGIHDLGGNVAEWTATVFVPGDRGADVDRSPDRPMVLRGGSYAQSLMARTSGRKGLPPSGIGDNLGFRCKFRSP